jgi:hypothetical protein
VEERVPESEPYPEDRVVGLIDGPQDIRAAVDALSEAGYAGEDVTVLCGPSGLERLDADGSRHGLLGRLIRLVQNYGLEREQLRHVEEELRRGHFAVSVRVPDDASKRRAADLLAEHGGHYLHYYGRWDIEQLLP